MSESSSALHLDAQEAHVVLLVERALSLYSHLDIQRDSFLLRRWAMLTYLTDCLGNRLLGLEDPPFLENRTAPTLDDYYRLCTLLLRYEETLGITPAARLKLGDAGESVLSKAKGDVQ